MACCTRALALGALTLLPACADGPELPPLLLIVTVDTLRADRLGAFGSTLDLTPNLDALAAESILFERAYATASFTLPSVASIFTGRYPEELGIRDNESAVPATAPSLATVLRAAGWRTGAVVSNFVLRSTSGLAVGFDVFDDEFNARESTRGWPERPAADTTDAALVVLDALSKHPGPLLLWVHYQDPHGPYTPPPGTRAPLESAAAASPLGARVLSVRSDSLGIGGIPDYQFLDDRRDAAFYLAGYNAEVRETDRAIGALLDGVRARGLLDEAVVVFSADHGEGLGEDDYWFAHGELLSDPLVNVPFMLRVPGRSAARRQDVASLVDVLPTLLGLMQEPLPDGLPGRDLLASENGGTAYLATLGGARTPKFALVEGDHKYVLTRVENGWKGQLFERLAGQTEMPVAPGTTGPVMRRRLKRLQNRFDSNVPESHPVLSDAELEALRALGYTGREDGR